MKNKGYKVLLVVVLFAVVIAIVMQSSHKSKANNKINMCDTTFERDTKIYMNNGKYTIDRDMLKNETPMGDKGVWTIFVYMCGSDYETKNGAASRDISEMISGCISKNVRVILQTGGSKKWHNKNISADKIQRFCISNGKMITVNEKNLYDSSGNVRSMGSPDELYDFLSWGIDNYASEKMGLILWNHGGGSSDGVCYDELADMESLKLGELELALCNVRNKMTSRFEFVGFDACVMQNIETANLMVPYAKYMVGSETAELDKGFEYKGFLNLIGKDNNVSTLDVCKEICNASYDEYLKSVTGIISSGSIVFSVLDLDKVNSYLYEFNKVSEQLNKMINTDKYYSVLNKIENSTRFGAGQIDIEDMLKNIQEDIKYANIARVALKELVVYTKKSTVGSWYKNANGLSMFVSSEYAQLQNYNNLVNVAVNPYIVNVYESSIYGNTYGDLSLYNQEKIDWSQSDMYYSKDFMFVNDIFENEQEYRTKYYNSDPKYYLNRWFKTLKVDNGINILDESSNIKCKREIYTNENNQYSIDVANESLDKIKEAKVKIFSRVYNEEVGDYVYRELGITNEVDFNRQLGIINEKFNGKWLQLPNGYPLQVMKAYYKDNYIKTISPCYINDDYVYLYSSIDLSNNSVEILGYADTYENNFIQTKVLQQLNIGDVVQPMFMYTKNLENGPVAKDNEMNYAFCKVNDNFKLQYCQLSEEDLYCSIILEDVFGNEIYTPILKYGRGE